MCTTRKARRVDDFFLEFFPPNQRNADHAVYFQREVLEKVHVNGTRAARRCLFLDRTDLKFGFYPRLPTSARQQLAMSLSAVPPGKNVTYFEKNKVQASGEVIVHRFDDAERDKMQHKLIRNRTHLIEIIVPRRPTDRVFSLSQ
ncbi:MAG: hypothetical protein WDN31_11465 [Hyphomicrobium sp.]